MKIKEPTLNHEKPTHSGNKALPEDTHIITTVRPTEEGVTKKKKQATFHRYTYTTGITFNITLSESDKKRLIKKAVKHSFLTVEDYILSKFNEFETMDLTEILKVQAKNSKEYDKTENVLKVHELNKYNPKLFSCSNVIRDSKQSTLDSFLMKGVTSNLNEKT